MSTWRVRGLGRRGAGGAWLLGAVVAAFTGCGGSGEAPTGAAGSGGAAGGATGGSAGAAGGGGGTPHPVVFTTRVLSTEFVAEGATFGDVSGDGVMDVIAGPWWFAGPAFTVRHELRTPRTFDVRGYSDDFFSWARDLDGDGDVDVLKVGFPGQDASIHENPGGGVGTWARHVVLTAVDAESPEWVDVTGDGLPELVYASGGRLGWAGPAAGAPFAPWVFHPATADLGFPTFTHGLGAADVDGDGRRDLLEAAAWYRQPASLAGDPPWERHPVPFAQGGAQMGTLDADGDGDRDVVTTLQAHGTGLSWFEQEAGAFTEHAIVPLTGGVPLWEPHALALADLNGDGLTDLVTGERFWGHAPPVGTPFEGPARLYWFEQVRDGAGTRFEPHVIHEESGVGTQVWVADATGDGRPDVVVASKRGIFVSVQD